MNIEILYFKEDEHISPDKFYNILSEKSDGDPKAILDKLELAHILKHKIPKIDIDHTEEHISQPLKEYYSFKYVGILLLENIFFIVYPKYIININSDIDNNHSKFLQILKVLDKYKNLNFYTMDNEEISDNYLGLQIKLIKDYFVNGLYDKRENVIELNGVGSILWEKTIDEIPPVILNEKFFYLELFTKNELNDDQYIIRKLHATILSQISKKLSGLLNILDLPTLSLTEDNIHDFGDNSYLEYLIEKELNSQYITDKQQLLMNLLNYIRMDNILTSSQKIEGYGTSSFNLVWEKICKTIYSNNLNDPINSLNLKSYGSIYITTPCIYKKNSRRWKDRMSNKVFKNIFTRKKINYYNVSSLKEVVSSVEWEIPKKKIKSGKLILDVLHVNNKSKTFEIYDAKYYAIDTSNNILSGQPGVNDIIKQYLYQLAFQDLANLNNYSFSNNFVVPMDNCMEDTGNGVKIALAKIDFLNIVNKDGIKIIGRDCELIYEQYLHS